MNLTKLPNLSKVTFNSLLRSNHRLWIDSNYWVSITTCHSLSAILNPISLPPIHLIVPTTHWSSTSHWSDDPLVCSSQVLWPIGSISHWSYLLYILSYIPLVPCSTSPTTYSPYAPFARGLIGPRDWTPCDTWPIGPTKYWPFNPIVWWFIGPTNQSQYVVLDQWLVCALDQWSNAQTSHWSCELLFLCSMGSMNWSQDDRHSTSFACADYEIIRILFLSNMFLSTK